MCDNRTFLFVTISAACSRPLPGPNIAGMARLPKRHAIRVALLGSLTSCGMCAFDRFMFQWSYIRANPRAQQFGGVSVIEQVLPDGQDSSGKKGFHRWSVEAKRALFFARQVVSSEGGSEVGPLHLLAGIIQAASGTLSGALSPASPDDLLQKLLPMIRTADKHDESEDLPFSGSLVSVFQSVDSVPSHSVTPAVLLQEAWRLDPSVRDLLAAFGMTQTKIDRLQ